jgi:hypothetical protein
MPESLLATLRHVARTIVNPFDLDQLLQELIDQAVEVCELSMVTNRKLRDVAQDLVDHSDAS